MEQNLKELLLKDLCARLPYWVKVTWDDKHPLTVTPHVYCAIISEDNINKLPKIYLRPMSSMTEEEREDFWWNVLDMDWKDNFDYDDDDEPETIPFPFVENNCGFYIDNYYLKDTFAVIDWLNAHHFDYRGLIEKGLALEAPEGMYKLKEK